MAYQKYSNSNNAQTTLAAGIGASALSMIVKTDEGDLFPSTYPYLLTLEKYDDDSQVIRREIIKVTNRSGDTFTIVRSQGTCVQDDTADPKVQGTTARTFESGDFVSVYVTNEQIDDIQDELTRIVDVDIAGLEADKADDDEVVHLDGDETIENIKTFNASPIVPTPTTDYQASTKKYVDDEVVAAQDTGELIDDSYMLGEAITPGQCAFLESLPVTADADTKQNIGDTANNTRVHLPIIGTGEYSNTFNVNVCKTGATHPIDQALYFRIETDNSGEPSGTLIDPNAIAHILPADLTTSLVDTEVAIGEASDEDTNVTYDTSTSITYKTGYKVTFGNTTKLSTVTKDSSCTATKCYLLDSNKNTLDIQDFVGDVATFNYFVEADNYYIMVDADGASYNSESKASVSFPIDNDLIDYIAGLRYWDILDLNVNGYGQSTSGTNPITQSEGQKILTKDSILLTTVSKHQDCTATRAILKDSGGSAITTANFVGNIATFNYQLSDATIYRIEADNSGSSYIGTRNAGGLYNSDDNIEYTSGSANGVDATGSYNITTISTQLNLEDINGYNIISANAIKTMAIPEGEKAHLVAFMSTSDDYADTEIDATDYYNIGYDNSIDTSTRPLGTYDGSDWSGGYIQSNGFEDSLIYTLVDGTINSDSKITPYITPSGPTTNDWETSGIITTDTITDSLIACSADVYTQTTSGVAASVNGMIVLYRDTDNYVRVWNNNTNSGNDYHYFEVYAGGSSVYLASVNLGLGGNIKNTKFKILKDGNDYSAYYWSGSRTQIGATQTNAFSGSPKFLCTASANGNSKSVYIENPVYTNVDFSTQLPIINGVFPYISSDLVQDKVLSLADATYEYKTDIRGFAIETGIIGEYPKLTFDGINGEFNDLTPDTEYFLTDVPGEIDTTPGTETVFAGVSRTDTKLRVGGNGIRDGISLSNNTVYKATTDGFVGGSADAGSSSGMGVNIYADYVDGTTVVAVDYCYDTSGADKASALRPVKKGQYYKVDIGLTAGSNVGTVISRKFYPLST